ncbi:hypothetical protein OKW96_06015 [Sphingobacterium sp. KU25419]|nr:hypothetical protein OKW96_06015 [Sphingobacterium sp. KU25419]
MLLSPHLLFPSLMLPALSVSVGTKKPLFRPDRNHLHHKFLRSGMSHHQAMLFILGLVLFFCIFNIVLVEYISNNIVLFLDALLWITFHYIFNKIERNKLEKKIVEPIH